MYDTLYSALAGPTGISYGLAQIVPLLLRADSSGSTLFSRMTGKRVIGREWCRAWIAR